MDNGGLCQPKRRRFTSWPQQQGQINFDLNNNLEETPYQNSSKKRKAKEIDNSNGSAMQHTRRELIEMSSDQHARLVNRELDNIYQKIECRPRKIPYSPRSNFSPIYVPTSSSIGSFQASGNSPAELADQIFDTSEHHHRTELVKAPMTRPVTEQQLIDEVRGIYAGLVMVEKKCVEIVEQQNKQSKRLSGKQWQALVALHRTLLAEHHDFFSATHHPVASLALRQLAHKYAMPARMWRHGLHPFLELIQKQCADDPVHMKDILEFAFGMLSRLAIECPDMADDWADVAQHLHRYVDTLRHLGVALPETSAEILSRETFLGEDVSQEWIECLGDLARYKMAIGDSDLLDRESWSNVATMRYDEAGDSSPNGGRIHHHLDVLARPCGILTAFVHGCSSECLNGGFEVHQPLLASHAPDESHWREDFFQHLNFSDSLWALMAGWCEIGGLVSRSFRSFHKLFTFLPYATAPLILK